MSSNNQVILIGHVANEVKDTFQYVPQQPGYLTLHGKVSVTLAVHRPGRRDQSTDYVTCIFEGKNADDLIFLKKGDMLCAYGCLRLDTIEVEGVRQTNVYIDCHQYELLGSKRKLVA